MAFPQEWHYYAPIVIQNAQVSGGPHTDFPVYLQEECLPDVMLTTGDDQASLATGADIRFTSDAAGAIELPFHLVEYTQNGNPALASANIWVKVPSIVNGADTTIYIWWGNPAASAYAASDTYGQYNVWTANSHRYMLDDDQDATVNNRDITDVGVVFGAGKIDDGAAFDASGGEDASFAWLDETIVSFEFWINIDAARVAGERVIYAYPFEIYIDDPNANKFRLFFKSNWDNTDGIWRIDTEYDTGTWYHFLVTYDGGAVGNDPTFTLDGAVVAGGAITETSTPVGNLDSFNSTGRLGRSASADPLHGEIDEVFITVGSEVASDWGISAYNNQNAPTTFSVEGTVETFYHTQLLSQNNIRPYQDVDPLIAMAIRAYQGNDLVPAFGIGGYQGSESVGMIIPEYEILTKSGYRITAVDTTTLEETELGFIDHAAAPLTLSSITLADGTYDIRIYLQGFLWIDARLINTIRATVSGGVVAVELPPPIENLAYEQLATFTRFIWTWSQTFGALDPDSFGVWISIAAPPSTAGTPDFLITAETARNYAVSYEQGYTDTIWVAVAAITGATRGPESRVTALAPLAALSSPAAQKADDDELL